MTVQLERRRSMRVAGLDVEISAREPAARRIAGSWLYRRLAGRDAPARAVVGLRALAERVLPASLAGRRCLYLGPPGAPWIEELERRGAREVRVLGIDDELDGADAGSALGAPTGETFDFVLVADALGAIRDPRGALERLRAHCLGSIVVIERFQPRFDRYGAIPLLEYVARRSGESAIWWVPSLTALREVMIQAGFEDVVELLRSTAMLAGGEGEVIALRAEARADPALRVTLLAIADHHAPAVAPKGALRRDRVITLGPLAVRVSTGSRVATRISRSLAYRTLLRPVLDKLSARDPEPRPVRPDDQKVVRNESPEARALWSRVEGIDWYHTLDLGHGVVTPGVVDHGPQLQRYSLPVSLAGLRCLDVATFDGFWAFEMERRGAHEVVAIDIEHGHDIDVPRIIRADLERRAEWQGQMGAGFRVAADVYRSRVRHEIRSVYELAPERDGLFDLVFVSDVLLHLRDPQLALQRIFSVCRGTLVLADVIEPSLDAYEEGALSVACFWVPGAYTWWLPSAATLRRMIRVAGFDPIETVDAFTMPRRGGESAKVVLRADVPGGRPVR